MFKKKLCNYKLEDSTKKNTLLFILIFVFFFVNLISQNIVYWNETIIDNISNNEKLENKVSNNSFILWFFQWKYEKIISVIDNCILYNEDCIIEQNEMIKLKTKILEKYIISNNEIRTFCLNDYTRKFWVFTFKELDNKKNTLFNKPIAEITNENICEYIKYNNDTYNIINQNISLQLKDHHKQTKTLSCESNTLKDMINVYKQRYWQKNITEEEIINNIPYDNSPFYKSSWKYYWGDPEKWFVWKINWYSAFKRKEWYWYNLDKLGRGIFPEALIPTLDNYINEYWLYWNKWSFKEWKIIASLHYWNPIMFWYIYWKNYNNPKQLTITTKEWKDYIIYENEHVWVIVWVDIDNQLNITNIYYYDWLSKNINKVSKQNFLDITKFFDKYIYIKEIIK